MSSTLKAAAAAVSLKAKTTDELVDLMADPAHRDDAKAEFNRRLSEAESKPANGSGTVSVKSRLLETEYTNAKKEKSIGKGNVNVYGVNARFPISLYPEQWVRMFDVMRDVAQTIVDDADKGLAFKHDKQTAVKTCRDYLAAHPAK